MGVREEK